MPKSAKENLSHLVKRLVNEKNLSLGEVRERSGRRIATSYISRIMTGNVENITLSKLVALARGLGEDPHLLLTAYCDSRPGSAIEPQEVIEWGAVEFVEMMRKVAGSTELSEIMKEATQLWPEEYQVVLAYLRELNERKQRSKQKRLSNRRTTI